MLCINWNDNFLHACKVHTSDPDRAVRLLVPSLNRSSICNLDGVIPALLLLADSNVMYCKANHRGRGILHACISCAFLKKKIKKPF